MPVTLQQIAEAAGVSRGTVDRALKDRGRVRPEVAEKIKQIAKEMGYQPSLAGRALVLAKRNLKIGIIMQSAQTPFMVQVYEGMKAAKQEVESLGGTVEIFRVDGVDAGRVMEIMQDLKEQEYSGIALSPSEDTMLKKMINQFSEEYSIPIITFNSDIEDTKRICFVGQNTIQSGKTAAGLMGEITGGEGEVAVISGHISNPALNNRIRGFQSEILESFPDIQLVGTKYSYDDEWVAAKIVEELLEQYPELKGIYVTGTAVKGVCEALVKQGKEREIKVIGNDFLDENKKWVERGAINFLIGQDSYMQGYEPVMMLFHLLFDGEKPESVYRYAEIVIKNRYNL
ncbi:MULTISPECIES: LacI family DNA-binding transcriptional regulator [Blautia]|uniref:LacI family DNA-binding transcriptional regulator n=1 Tax=Blautia TaxID=572511 RepID=UPI000BA4C87F|nr:MULTISPECIES: LacI family DNA-binding transcriptional regulator [Blautia]